MSRYPSIPVQTEYKKPTPGLGKKKPYPARPVRTPISVVPVNQDDHVEEEEEDTYFMEKFNVPEPKNTEKSHVPDEPKYVGRENNAPVHKPSHKRDESRLGPKININKRYSSVGNNDNGVGNNGVGNNGMGNNGGKKYENRGGNDNGCTSTDGPYAKVEQLVFVGQNEDSSVSKTVGEHVIDEEIMAKEIVPGEMYSFNLGITGFITELEKRMVVANANKKKQNIKLQVIDNYYLYQHIFSIKDGVRSNYVDQEIDWKWNRITRWYRRSTKRTYGDSAATDLDSYRDYHAVVRIIRFQMSNNPDHKLPEIFEVIIPRSSGASPTENVNGLYQPPTNFIDLLLIRDLKTLNLPNNTEFMIRRQVAVEA